jgi:hypothetical protein
MKNMSNSYGNAQTGPFRRATLSILQDAFCFLSFREWMRGFLNLARNHAQSSCTWGAAISPLLPVSAGP